MRPMYFTETIEKPAPRNVIIRKAEPKNCPVFKVSAVIITYNEEKMIERTLAQLQWCDEIIVVDSYSTDRTAEICSSKGCKVLFRQFDGYGAQKQFAVSQAKNDWVLCVDADEVLTDELVKEITSLTEADKQYSGFAFRMNLVFLGKEFLYGKESGRYFLRLFNRQKGGITADKVHEGIHLEGPVKKLKHIVKHYSYTSIYQYLEKFNRYTRYAAEMGKRKGKHKSTFIILLAVPFNFTKYYLLERNCLNGLKGFYWSVFSTFYHFVKYAKINE
ncbi:glycosyl transferase family 2 [Niastella koreensis GR20-10]|uniref:Glycosyl transferase family 2 n=2 Tax=Niastella koreensis TaxID=354356 RepID=G8TD37_NIAKG|nr:glycosyltransferase family 2 protein [Niastella koreensis]AEV98269.1 glycosyl transferase family 2 [Niastella koreensis GR20-10]